MSIHILGIRHHGVGSAKQVQKELERLQPDLILVEGPPEVSELFKIVDQKTFKPPLALLVYNTADPKQSCFYPFASYSPEWITINYGQKNNVEVRAMDLPAAASFLMEKKKEEEFLKKLEEGNEDEMFEKEPKSIVTDPLSYLADAVGYSNSEEWWDQQFEQNASSSEEHFEAVMYAMEALREEGIPSTMEVENEIREAYMRNIIREAKNEMHQTIAIVCGAWHAPALKDDFSDSKKDNKILKTVPKRKLKVSSTWIPWTNSRLSYTSGYGAGITSPGWYEHQWETKNDIEVNWLTKVAHTYRKKDIDMSTAHIMEAYKLAVALAALRGHSFVNKQALDEAVLSVMCMGDEIKMELIEEQLVLAEKIGEVPDAVPKVPLQEDFEKWVKKYRLKLNDLAKEVKLDLRKENDLNKSIFFHRLELLEVPWAQKTYAASKGTFKELWLLKWKPEIMVKIIEHAYLGNSIETATQSKVIEEAKQLKEISNAASLLKACIPAELFKAIEFTLGRINELSAISSDVKDLMSALPQLVDLSRYGNVRKSDLTVLSNIVENLLIKVYINLPNACYQLDEENSNKMFNLILDVNNAVRIYQDKELTAQWYQALHKVMQSSGVHPIIRGCTCRLLSDAQFLSQEVTEKEISTSLSIGNPPQNVASWIEGFLRGNASILIYDNHLWNLLYTWVGSLSKAIFVEMLPMLRRAFSQFEPEDRFQIGQKAKRGIASSEAFTDENENRDFDQERADQILPVLSELMGI
ncbi:DUF5682 family protein [Flammeovirga sp. EKP202]|uniref:DUF5682 family protein n=1 Tax=Flammeovirga sp. EKP202 TaxID=2770592 RepID=UPI00165F843D|nr:DUF5682 family protein [Flammeovirga sp. EKP202]MBD0403916.1 hypothetical protein [Flammeovirga sp. EKP202]